MLIKFKVSRIELQMIEAEKLGNLWRWNKNLRHIIVQFYRLFLELMKDTGKTNKETKMNLVIY